MESFRIVYISIDSRGFLQITLDTSAEHLRHRAPAQGRIQRRGSSGTRNRSSPSISARSSTEVAQEKGQGRYESKKLESKILGFRFPPIPAESVSGGSCIRGSSGAGPG